MHGHGHGHGHGHVNMKRDVAFLAFVVPEFHNQSIYMNYGSIYKGSCDNFGSPLMKTKTEVSKRCFFKVTFKLLLTRTGLPLIRTQKIP